MATRCVKSLVLKLCALLATFLAAVIMGINKQDGDFGGLVITASYKMDPTFKFYVIGNVIVALYCLTSLPLIFKDDKFFIESVLDMLAASITLAAAAAATAVGYLAEVGNTQIGWLEVCSYFKSYCVKSGVSFVLSYVGFIFLFLLCTNSYFHLYKKARRSTIA